MMWGTQPSVSTLLTTVGLPNRPTDRRKRRLRSRVGALAFQRIQQPGLISANVTAAAEVQIQAPGCSRNRECSSPGNGARRLPRWRAKSAQRPAYILRAERCTRRPPRWRIAATIAPSMSWCGSRSINSRSLNVPGSISSALTTRYVGLGASLPSGTNDHFKPV